MSSLTSSCKGVKTGCWVVSLISSRPIYSIQGQKCLGFTISPCTGCFDILHLDRVVWRGQGFKHQSSCECGGAKTHGPHARYLGVSFANGPCRIYNCWEVIVLSTSEQGTMPCAYTPCVDTPDSHHVQDAVFGLTNGKHVHPLLSPWYCRTP